MKALTALAYRSKAVHPPSQAELEAVLFDARAFNAHSGVTGVLLVARGRFFQYLEGPDAAVKEALAKVRASRLHSDIEVIFEATVPARMFDTWHMGLLEVHESTFLRIANADWQAELVDHSHELVASPTMRSLMEAWSTASASPR